MMSASVKWQDETEDAGAAHGRLPPEHHVRGFRVEIVSVAAAGAPSAWTSSGERCQIGSNPKNDVVLSDRTVSRFHAEIRIEEAGAKIKDLGSRNGTTVDGVQVQEAWLREGSTIRVGNTTLRFTLRPARTTLPLSPRTRFGGLVGSSVAMRSIFAQLERVAKSESTVLLTGETGTGKEEAAQAIHEASDRSEGPFVVVDCGTVVQTLVESELFGHERGAFTGADRARGGAFEIAHGGTIFLDEIGELPLELQPRLLRVLERKRVRRLGGNEERAVDVRVVAATNRDLRSAANQGTFREDLYYRLAVVEIELPSLRSRPEDLPLLIDVLLERLDPEKHADWLDRQALSQRLSGAAWPGNVRQLRNYLSQCVAFREPPAISAAFAPDAASLSGAPYEEARRLALDSFERQYVTVLLDRHGGNVSEAARAAGLNRTYLHRLLRRHGIRG
jgi:two-component system response regulator GlrR